MENNWQKYKLSDVLEVGGGGTPKTKVPEYWEGNIKWLTPTDVTSFQGRYIKDTSRKITELGLKNSSTKLYDIGTIMMTSRATIGYPVINLVPMCTNQGFINIKCKDKINSLFFLYWIKNNKTYIESMAEGTTFREISKKVFKELNIILPSIKKQKKIAMILSSLDDKIELNNEINKTLEEMAAAIFKSWFVDFEPFKDGEFVDSELGKIPKGFEIKKLSEIGNIITGKTPSKNNQEFFGDNYKFITPKDINGETFIIKTERGISDEGYSKMQKNKHIKYSIGVSCIGSDLGEVYLNDMEGFTNQQINTLTLNNEKLYPFVYITLKNMKVNFKNMALGSAVPIINKTTFSNIQVIIPSNEYIENFYKKTSVLFEKILLNINNNEELKLIRDTLLPKLISGEIEV